MDRSLYGDGKRDLSKRKRDNVANTTPQNCRVFIAGVGRHHRVNNSPTHAIVRSFPTFVHIVRFYFVLPQFSTNKPEAR